MIEATNSRRDFLHKLGKSTIGAAILASAATTSQAEFPLGLPPGLQLWTVRRELAEDEDGTLRQVAQIGFRELEHYRLPQAPAEFRKKCQDLGLKLIGSHIDMPMEKFGSQDTIDAAKQMELQYMVVVFPALRSLSDPNTPRMSFAERNALYEKISVDDYKWNAEQCNKYGELVKKAGMQLAYHNHAIDLKKLEDGRMGLEVLIEASDPDLVVFEMDCGHVIHAGADPIAFLQKYPKRIQLLHVKDLKAGYSVSSTLDTENKDTDAEIGAGVIDWKRLFASIKRENLKHWFLELEGKMDHPPMESITNSYNFLKNL